MPFDRAVEDALREEAVPAEVTTRNHAAPAGGAACGSGVAGGAPGALTRREREVVALVTQGLSNRDIGHRLAITERTAENYVEHILTKLGFHSRVQIAVWAAEQGLQPAA